MFTQSELCPPPFFFYISWRDEPFEDVSAMKRNTVLGAGRKRGKYFNDFNGSHFLQASLAFLCKRKNKGSAPYMVTLLLLFF